MTGNKKLLLLIEALLRQKTTSQMLRFLTGILTPQELEEIPNRLEIIRLLKSGVAQHQIAKELSVGVATVTRGSKELKKGLFENV